MYALEYDQTKSKQPNEEVNGTSNAKKHTQKMQFLIFVLCFEILHFLKLFVLKL